MGPDPRFPPENAPMGPSDPTSLVRPLALLPASASRANVRVRRAPELNWDRSVDFGHEHRRSAAQSSGSTLRLPARVHLPAQRLGSHLSLVYPRTLPCACGARGESPPSSRG